jgi:hypothetical protein
MMKVMDPPRQQNEGATFIFLKKVYTVVDRSQIHNSFIIQGGENA